MKWRILDVGPSARSELGLCIGLRASSLAKHLEEFWLADQFLCLILDGASVGNRYRERLEEV